VPVSYSQASDWIRAFAATVAENKVYLTELDSAIGDADHGINMNRGMQAVVAKMDGISGPDIGALLKTVGMTLVSTVGGAGGPLYGGIVAGRLGRCPRRRGGRGAEQGQGRAQ
jgi:dihydroxyacetone kinase-like protein